MSTINNIRFQYNGQSFRIVRRNNKALPWAIYSGATMVGVSETLDGAYDGAKHYAKRQGRKAAGAKAAQTKGEQGFKLAGLKAKATKLRRRRDALSGAAKGKMTRELNKVLREIDQAAA